MKSRIKPLIAITFLFGAISADSQTLNWASLTTSEIVDSQGIELSQSAYVFELGAFDTGFVPDESNLNQWVSSWHVFNTADYTYDPNTSTANFSGTANAQDVAGYLSLFQGLSAYLFIHNSSNTEFFLARPSDTLSWRFPTLDPGCCPNGEVTTWSVSDLKTDPPIWGSQGGVEGGGTGLYGVYDIQTYEVPEAGSLLLALVGGGFVLMRRRRINA